ncbi:MAG: cytochrome c oxidase subunit II [Bacteroidota bacterium]
MTIIVTISAVLILVVLGLLLKIQGMVDVLRGTHHKRETLSNKVNAALFPVFLIVGTVAFVWFSIYASQFYLPEASSIHGKVTDKMFWESIYVVTFVFIATHILLFIFPYIYQFREGHKATFFPDNNKLELIWTVIPAIVLALLVIGGWKEWSSITGPAPADHVELEIVGKQFDWMVRYPGADHKFGKHDFRKIDGTNVLGLAFTEREGMDDFMADKVYIPKGKAVLFKIRSRDVLHSVFAFHFRQKMDAVPGMPTQFWFTPTKTTAEMRAELNDSKFDYAIACAEVCGKSHFAMKQTIIVLEQSEYDKWYNEQKSFINKNPQYISMVPDNLKAVAMEQIAAPAKVASLVP